MITGFSHDWPLCVMFFPCLNLGLQGHSTTIFNVRDNIGAIIKKLELFSVCINKDTTHKSFHHCMTVCANELKLTDNVKCDIVKHE